MIQGLYINQKMLEARMTAVVMRRIYDDSNLGAPDDDPVQQVISDAEQWFESVAIGVYPDLTSLRAQGGPTAKFLVLDCAQALASKRFPRAVNREWLPLWDNADKQLMRLRKGEIKLPIQGAPNPPANTGGSYFERDQDITDEQPETFHRNGFGDF